MFSLGKEKNIGSGRGSGSVFDVQMVVLKNKEPTLSNHPPTFTKYPCPHFLTFCFFFLFLFLLLHSNLPAPSTPPHSHSISESIPRPFDLLTLIGQEPTLFIFLVGGIAHSTLLPLLSSLSPSTSHRQCWTRSLELSPRLFPSPRTSFGASRPCCSHIPSPLSSGSCPTATQD